jgi:hypothetical protein
MLLIFLLLFIGCSSINEVKTSDIVSVQQLVLTGKDIKQLGLSSGGACSLDENYSNIIDSSAGQYSFCNYTINSINHTEIAVILQKFADYEALNGSYQYDSLHLYSVEGIISENTFGDQSRFRVNNEHDYGGEFNPPGVYFYHLWIANDLFLIHITSGGSKEAKQYVTDIGGLILSKFDWHPI